MSLGGIVRQKGLPLKSLLTLATLVLGGLGLVAGIGLAMVAYQQTGLGERLQDKVKALEAVRQQLRGARLPDEAERVSWKLTEELVKRKIPPDREAPALLKELGRVVTDVSEPDVAALTAEQYKRLPGGPSAPAAGGPVAGAGCGEATFVKITFQARYWDIIDLLGRVGELDRLVELEKLKLTRKPPRIAVELVLKTTYMRKKDRA